MKKLALFDLDGTLIDTRDLYFVGIPKVTKKFLDLEIRMQENMDLWGKDVKVWFKRFIEQKGIEDDDLNDKMYDSFEKWYIDNHSDVVEYYNGIDDVLSLLKRKGWTIGIITTRPQHRAELANQLRWGHYIDFIIGGDRVTNRKPAPDSVNLAIEIEGADNCKAFFMGDNASDIMAAKSSKYDVKSFAALWGSEKPKALLDSEPDMKFSSVEEFQNWIKLDYGVVS